MSASCPEHRRKPRWPIAALVAVCAVLIAYCAAIALMRCLLPAQLDVLEGKVICQASAAAAGEKMYGDPVEHGAPTMYTPFYHIVLAVLFKLVGAPSFAAGRLLSCLFAASTAAIIALPFLRRNKLAGLVVLALLCASAWCTDWIACTAKPDSLCCLLSTAGLAAVARSTASGAGASAVLLAAGWFAKQTALLAIPGAALFLWIRNRRALPVFAGSFVAAWLVLSVVFRQVAGERLLFYTFGRTGGQFSATVFHFPVSRFLAHASSMAASPCLFAAALAALLWHKELRSDRTHMLAALSLPFLLIGGLFIAASVGGGANSLAPAYCAMAYLAGFVVARVIDTASIEPRAVTLLAVLLAFQLDWKAPYNFNKARGKFDRDFIQLTAFLKARSGTMYAPCDNILTLLAGRPENDDLVLARELGWHWNNGPALERIARKINSGAYDWLIFKQSEDDEQLFAANGRAQYALAGEFGEWRVYGKKTPGVEATR